MALPELKRKRQAVDERAAKVADQWLGEMMATKVGDMLNIFDAPDPDESFKPPKSQMSIVDSTDQKPESATCDKNKALKDVTEAEITK